MGVTLVLLLAVVLTLVIVIVLSCIKVSKITVEEMRTIRNATENRCVCCGSVIPEGRQVCPVCEMAVSKKGG